MGAPILQAVALVQATFASAAFTAVGAWLLALAHPALVRWTERERGSFETSWRFVHVFVCALMFLAANIALAMIALLLDGERAFETVTAPLLVTAGAGLGAALPLLAVAQTQGFGIGWLGFGRGGYARSIALGLVLYLVGSLWVFGMTGVWAFALEVLGAFDQQEVATLIDQAPSSSLPVIVACAVFVIPWAEEVLFRGVLFGWLHRTAGPAAAVLLSSLAFAAVHGLVAFWPIFCLALLLAFARLRSRGILAPTVIHMVHNGLQVLILQVTSL